MQQMKTKVLMLTIDGDPMGKQRPKVAVLGKSKYAHAYTPKETINYESRVIDTYNNEVRGMNVEGTYFPPKVELFCMINAYFQIPQSHYKYYKRENCVRLDDEGMRMKNGFVKPTKKPDCDNIAKIILDALNGLAFYDDSQIVNLVIRKHYAEKPKVEVYIKEDYGSR